VRFAGAQFRSNSVQRTDFSAISADEKLKVHSPFTSRRLIALSEAGLALGLAGLFCF
jgi:hypothetical protein